jgi:probable rRNA maturation factor
VLLGERIRRANVSIVVVDDRTIHRLNRRFLNHDEPTDVITFSLEEGDSVDGEIITSADTAAAAAKRFGWTMADELLLYAVHGALHLAGYDDQAPTQRRKMRSRERWYLAKFGLKPQYDTETTAANLKTRV